MLNAVNRWCLWSFVVVTLAGSLPAATVFIGEDAYPLGFDGAALHRWTFTGSGDATGSDHVSVGLDGRPLSILVDNGEVYIGTGYAYSSPDPVPAIQRSTDAFVAGTAPTIDGGRTIYTPLDGTAYLANPHNLLASAGGGDFYAAGSDDGGDNLVRVTPNGSGGSITSGYSPISTGAGSASRGLTVSPWGEIFLLNQSSAELLRFTDNGSGFTPNGSHSGGSLNNPHALVFRGNELYVANTGGDSIIRLSFDSPSTSGVITESANYTDIGLSGPYSMALSPWDELWVGNTSNHDTGNPASNDISRFTFSGDDLVANGVFDTGFSGVLGGIAFGQDTSGDPPPPPLPPPTYDGPPGILFVGENDQSAGVSVHRFSVSGPTDATGSDHVEFDIAARPQGFAIPSATPNELFAGAAFNGPENPTDVAVMRSTNPFSASPTFDSSREISRVLNNGSTDADITNPHNAPAAVLGNSGDIYVAGSNGGNSLARISPTATGGDLLYSIGADNARGVAVSPWGEVFVADFSNNVINRYLDTGSEFTANGSISGGGLSSPHGMIFIGGELFVANNADDTISRFTFSGGSFEDISAGSAFGSQIDQPMGLAVAPWGELWISSESIVGQLTRFYLSGGEGSAVVYNGVFSFDAEVPSHGIYFALAPTIVPETSTLVMALMGISCVMGVARRRRGSKRPG